MNHKQELFRQLPKIDEVLKDQRLFLFFEKEPRELVVESVREEIEALRLGIGEGRITDSDELNQDLLLERILARLQKKSKRSLRPLINATGTIVHTNLGRARLSEAVCQRVAEAAFHYSTLEYDVEKGSRGSRHDHVEKIIRKITGAEAAMAVNNNAAALLLCLSALAAGKEVVVSRGELVEIGGSFRIPEIMEQGGAKLKEIGTTNKTRIQDYRNALVDGSTGMLLKVHTSNYKIVGFTSEASVPELVSLGRETGIPVVHDIGSGLMMDLRNYGIDEPTVMQSLDAGADVVLFSGDKLLGGPQAGIVAGKKELIDRMKKHPLARVVRLDKMTLAALEATFREYLDLDHAKETIPVLSMITVAQETLKKKAERLSALIREKTDYYQVEIEQSEDQIGGGSTPNQYLAGYCVSLSATSMSADSLERALRANQIPIIARINRDQLLLSVRTLEEGDLNQVAEALARIADHRRQRNA